MKALSLKKNAFFFSEIVIVMMIGHGTLWNVGFCRGSQVKRIMSKVICREFKNDVDLFIINY